MKIAIKKWCLILSFLIKSFKFSFFLVDSVPPPPLKNPEVRIELNWLEATMMRIFICSTQMIQKVQVTVTSTRATGTRPRSRGSISTDPEASLWSVAVIVATSLSGTRSRRLLSDLFTEMKEELSMFWSLIPASPSWPPAASMMMSRSGCRGQRWRIKPSNSSKNTWRKPFKSKFQQNYQQNSSNLRCFSEPKAKANNFQEFVGCLGWNKRL